MLSGRARRTIHEGDAKRLLAEAGLTVVRERVVRTLPEAQAAAAALGYPIALKVVSDEIPHRSDLGLVSIGVRDEPELAEEWARLVGQLDALGLRADGWLVQEMAGSGLEVFAGVSRDPDFGLVLAFGAGGLLIEALDDAAVRALPLREGDAADLIADTRVAALLAGFRGRPAGDVDALAACLDALADFAWAERDRIAEIDVNPIVVRERGRGCIVVDALIVPRVGA